MEENQKPMRTTLKEMEIGGSAVFPIGRTKGVRTQATELGAILSRKYRTALSREAGTITVTRVL